MAEGAKDPLSSILWIDGVKRGGIMGSRSPPSLPGVCGVSQGRIEEGSGVTARGTEVVACSGFASFPGETFDCEVPSLLPERPKAVNFSGAMLNW